MAKQIKQPRQNTASAISHSKTAMQCLQIIAQYSKQALQTMISSAISVEKRRKEIQCPQIIDINPFNENSRLSQIKASHVDTGQQSQHPRRRKARKE
jgi:hypothetical protein